MIAVDTNIPIRLIVGDDQDQIEAIHALMTHDMLFVPLTVMLETEWVLRSRYRYDRAGIVAALTALIALDGIIVQDSDGVTWAIERYARGSDFGDMIHLVASREAGRFATLDRGVAHHAPDAVVGIQTLV